MKILKDNGLKSIRPYNSKTERDKKKWITDPDLASKIALSSTILILGKFFGHYVIDSTLYFESVVKTK